MSRFRPERRRSTSLFVVERRLPNVSSAELIMLQEALSFTCRRLISRGQLVRCLGSAFLPGPARLLTLFEAERSEEVRWVNDNVHAPFISLEAAIEICPPKGAQ
ncbi:MAG TPA: hypothetical protein VKF14_05760 [Candidatus Dormibacteraeota bacterium]|nr:hypothetical protein [Candidatus Dormibacteraeota bacterium]